MPISWISFYELKELNSSLDHIIIILFCNNTSCYVILYDDHVYDADAVQATAVTANSSAGGILSTKDTKGFGSPRMGLYALIGVVVLVAILWLLKKKG